MATDDNDDSFKSALNRDRNWSAFPVHTPDKEQFPNVQKVTALVDGVAQLLKQAAEPQHDVIPDWAKPEVDVRFHIIKDGEMEKAPVGPVIKGLSVGLIESLMKKLSHLTLNQIHHYTVLGAYINDLYRVKEMVDVIIRIDDEIFTATRHCLSCHSDLFASIFLNSLVPPFAVTEVTLVDVDKEMFKRFIHFIHFGEVQIDEYTVEPLLNVCEILQSQTLKAKVYLFAMVKAEVKWPEAIMKLQKKPSALERLISIQTLIQKFRELLEQPVVFKLISFEDMKEIISSSELNILTELDVFWSVLYWTVLEKMKRPEHLDTLMQCVRFTCMSTLELLDCARANTMMSISTTCKQLLVKAHWICHANELGLDDPLLLKADAPRNHLIGAAPYVPTVKEFDSRYIAFKELSKSKERSSSLEEKEERRALIKERRRRRKRLKKARAAAEDEESRKKRHQGNDSDKSDSGNRGQAPDESMKEGYEEESEEEVEEDEEERAEKQPKANKSKKLSSTTHEFRGGHWKRKRHRGGHRNFDVSAALKNLALADLMEGTSDGSKHKTDIKDSGTVSTPSNSTTISPSVSEQDAITPSTSAATSPSVSEQDVINDTTPAISEENKGLIQPVLPVTSEKPGEPLSNGDNESKEESDQGSWPALESSSPEDNEPATEKTPPSLLEMEKTEVESTVSLEKVDLKPEDKPLPDEQKESVLDNISQNYRNVRMSLSTFLLADNTDGNDGPPTYNLLDEPDKHLSSHLYPVMKPISVKKSPAKRLSRERNEDK